MRHCATFIVTMVTLLCLSSASLAAEIWYQDSNLGRAEGIPADFVDKFRRPESFRQATRHIDVYVLRVNT
jgi:hypothetical protein